MFRNIMLHWAIEKIATKFNNNYKGTFRIQEASFSGLSTISLQKMVITAPNNDTVLKVASIEAHIKILPLILAHIRLDEVFVDSTSIQIFKTSKKDNISFLLRRNKKEKKDTVETSSTSIDMGNLAYNLVKTIFDVIPQKVQVLSTDIALQRDTAYFKTNVDTLKFIDGVFHCNFNTVESKGKSKYVLSGQVDKSERTLSFSLYPASRKDSTSFPILKSFLNLSVSFDTLLVALNQTNYDSDVLSLDGKALIKNGAINHWRISPKNIELAYAEVNYKFKIGVSDISLDSTSSIKLNSMLIKPFIQYQHSPKRTLAFDFNVPIMYSQLFFESLPHGLFTNIEGIKSKGDLGFKLHFFIDTKMPDSVQFVCSMPKNKFKITSYGEAHLNKLNEEFLYTAYEKGRAVKSFMVGPSNPNYVPLANISTYLQYALMTSEDGNFYWHNGFNENAFRKSIAENYKKGRFARGGSTISMQLVKNVFLTRNKTIARKIEEALIVWLIEGNRIVSKERMYEVYLNIIEWGPGVYGAGEASAYYFNKKAADLTLAESIYLAMIVPRPKWFKYNFDETGKLESHVADFYRIIANHLVKKEIITEEQKMALVADIEIKGPAKELILVKDTLAIDSLNLPEFNMNIESE
ncbi:MAG TPA: biosynthetic peptidoglycan transglycosylase [Bacteroidia bacterium]|nr:biosynthetic peptidoglycan transglycosylase [Bacteroidia bacterium]